MIHKKLPVEIEAVMLHEGSFKECCQFIGRTNINSAGREPEPYIFIRTLGGSIKASNGDWIIKGVSGEFYPCKPEIFWKTYESVSAGSPNDSTGE